MVDVVAVACDVCGHDVSMDEWAVLTIDNVWLCARCFLEGRKRLEQVREYDRGR
jgi:hypothetical protein